MALCSVSPAFGQPASLPFWRGDGLGRPAELGRALGSFVREVHAGGHRIPSSAVPVVRAFLDRHG